MSDVIYLYGFIPAGSTLANVPPGLDDAPVESVALGPVHAVVSLLPAEQYSAQTLDARLQDLDWVAGRGLAHERVVAWFVDHGEIVPAPLFTLFSSTDALRADAGPRADQVRATLTRFTGLREWDLKVAYRADTLTEHAAEVSDAVRALEEEIAAAAPGRRFLLERKRADLLKKEVSRAAHRIADELLVELRPHVLDTVRLSLPRAAAELPVILSAAVLVDRSGEPPLIEFLAARAESLRPVGIELAFSGPWAAYRFMGEPDDE